MLFAIESLDMIERVCRVGPNGLSKKNKVAFRKRNCWKCNGIVRNISNCQDWSKLNMEKI